MAKREKEIDDKTDEVFASVCVSGFIHTLAFG